MMRDSCAMRGREGFLFLADRLTGREPLGIPLTRPRGRRGTLSRWTGEGRGEGQSPAVTYHVSRLTYYAPPLNTAKMWRSSSSTSPGLATVCAISSRKSSR